jgi:phage FluMu protein Com
MFESNEELASQPEETKECRCTCGSLMAKLTAMGVEIKCRRCKRLQLIPFSRLTAEPEELSLKCSTR